MQLAHTSSLARFSAVALFGVGVLAAPACRSTTPVAAAAPGTTTAPFAAAAPASTPAGAPVAVNCGAGLQALIRPAVVAGQAISQVDCVPVSGGPAAPVAYAAAPAAAMPASYYEEPVVYRPAPRRVVRSAQYEPARTVRRKSGRSWQKSAVIIGSSAGIGAGVGGAVKGKKGALIGAAIGGGAATIWDQATRK